jgi:hypothetical protein
MLQIVQMNSEHWNWEIENGYKFNAEYISSTMSKHIIVVKLTSPTSGCRSVGIVRLRTKATEL